MRFLIAAAAALSGALAHWSAAAQDRPLAEVVERFENANRWRDHVMVAAHRGGWRENGRQIFAENSRAGVRHAIALGVEIVEIDVGRTRDGVLVVMHDSWLDRTTTCSGELAQVTAADLSGCRLVVEGTGAVTDEAVPTLAEMLAVTAGRVLVNVDNKIGPAALPAIARVVREAGVAGEVIVKENVWNAERLASIRDAVLDAGSGLRFMPILADDAVADPLFVEAVTKDFDTNAAELIAWRRPGPLLSGSPGPLFGARARAVSVRGDWHMWVNTFAVLNKPGGFLAGGRGDELAVAAREPEEVFGYWAERGVTIIQTDEPKAAIDWLAANGYRIPYALTN